MRRTLIILLALAAACSRPPRGPVDPELASYLPAGAAVVAGIDVDRLRASPLFSQLPESFRNASYVLAAYDPPNLVTAARVGGRIVATGPALKGAAPDLLQHATAAPLWIVARGTADLPLAGNAANLNRLLRQTEYTRVSANVAERVEFDAEGVCAGDAAAQRLEENVRAIASLMNVPVNVRREGAVVRVSGAATAGAIGKLF